MPALHNPTRQEIIDRIAEAGIVGMGGAGFPTAVKIQPKDPVDSLIINAAECEPYLNCDNRVMIERTEQFVQGVRLLATACNVPNVYIGIEANKMEAYAALVALDGVVGEKDPKREGDIVVVLLKKSTPKVRKRRLSKPASTVKFPSEDFPQRWDAL